MTEAVLGIDQILLYRILSEAGTLAASKLAFQTEHEVTESKDMDSVATKDGNIGVPGQLETEISATSILAAGDAMVKKLRNAMRENELVEVWDIDKTAAVGVVEVNTLTVTGAATSAGEVTITLNGVTQDVTVLSTDTTAEIGDKIRDTVFPGWTVSGTGTTVIFTKLTTGTNTAPTFSAGSTGMTATIAATVAGVADNKYPATYYQGYITEYSKSAGAEDTVEISFTFAPNGVGVDGQATLTTEQAAVVQYVFKDTTIQAG